MEKEIYLVRHGQSYGNAYPDSDMIDPPLTEMGRMQASRIKLNVDLVICSSMRRAMETLHYSQIEARELMITDLCREKICGVSDLKLLEEEEWEGEDNFKERIREIAKLLLSLEGGSIGVVCHGCVIAGLTGSYLKNGEIIKGDLGKIRMIAKGGDIRIKCCHTSW